MWRLNPVRAGVVTERGGTRVRLPESSTGHLAGTLAQDACYLGLADTNSELNGRRYGAYLEAGTPLSENSFGQTGQQESANTGNQCFIDEIERRVGARIKRRGRGGHQTGKMVRPLYNEVRCLYDTDDRPQIRFLGEVSCIGIAAVSAPLKYEIKRRVEYCVLCF